MDKKIIVNFDYRATRVAVMEDHKLVELYIERPLQNRVVGNIYKGIVANVLPGMQAAFIDIGMEKNAFLYVDDVFSDLGDDGLPASTPNNRRLPIEKLLKAGEEIMVQVIKEPFGTKGTRVTCSITLPGRYLVLVPGADHVGVSRRIEDQAEKDRLRQEVLKFKPEEHGLIIRTVAEGATTEMLKKDLQFLLQLWQRVSSRFQQKEAPVVIYQDLALTSRIARDLLTDEVNSFLIDNKQEYDRVLEILDYISPHLKKKVKLYREQALIFERYGVEKEIQKALERQVWLKSGGYVVFDETEALTVIDVNTGRYTGRRRLRETILKTNLEAAVEITRQIRLRDIGGIIVIDFIDMDLEEHRQRVLDRLNQCLKRDRTKTYVLGITSLGLVEMTRKKVRQDLSAVLQQPCPHCNGTGRVLTPVVVSTRIEGELKKLLPREKDEAVLIEMHHEVAALVIGTGGCHLKKLEEELGKHIFVRGSEDLHMEKYRVVATGNLEKIKRMALPVSPGEAMEVLIEEPHTANSSHGIARLEGYVINVEGAGEAVGQKLNIEITEVSRTFARATIINSGR